MRWLFHFRIHFYYIIPLVKSSQLHVTLNVVANTAFNLVYINIITNIMISIPGAFYTNGRVPHLYHYTILYLGITMRKPNKIPIGFRMEGLMAPYRPMLQGDVVELMKMKIKLLLEKFKGHHKDNIQICRELG